MRKQRTRTSSPLCFQPPALVSCPMGMNKEKENRQVRAHNTRNKTNEHEYFHGTFNDSKVILQGQHDLRIIESSVKIFMFICLAGMPPFKARFFASVYTLAGMSMPTFFTRRLSIYLSVCLSIYYIDVFLPTALPARAVSSFCTAMVSVCVVREREREREREIVCVWMEVCIHLPQQHDLALGFRFWDSGFRISIQSTQPSLHLGRVRRCFYRLGWQRGSRSRRRCGGRLVVRCSHGRLDSRC